LVHNIGYTFAVFKTLQRKNINNAKNKNKKTLQHELPSNPGARSGIAE
jgi:hypothetical protein